VAPVRAGNLGTLGICDFFIFRCSLRPESSQEQLPTSIAGVLRLRAMKPSDCDRAAKRFAQDDGFVGGYAENTKRAIKSPALGLAKGEGGMSSELGRDRGAPQVPPLRFAPVGMTRKGPLFAIGLRSASLRIAALLGICRKREKSEKVTGSLDDKGRGICGFPF
jgi:hypothetical protein